MTKLAQRLRATVNRSDSTSVVARGALGALLVNAAAAGAMFGLQVLLARLLGLSGYGLFVYAGGWAALLTVPGTLGFDSSVVRFAAAYQATGNWASLRGLMARSVAIVGAWSVAIVLPALAISRWRAAPEYTIAFALALASVPLFSLLRLHAGLLRGLRRVVLARASDLLMRPVALAGFVIAAYLILDEVSAEFALVLNLAASGAALILARLLLRRAWPSDAAGAEPAYDTRLWVSTSLPMLVMAGADVVNHTADHLMLGALVGPEAAGVYGAVSRLSTFVGFGLLSANAIVAPTIADLSARHDRRTLQRVVTFSAWGGFAFAVPVALILIGWAPSLLALFGAEFASGATALRVLAVAELANATCGSVGNLMTMTGYERPAMFTLLGSMIANVALNAILIPAFGVNGAAMATGASIVLWNGTLLVLCLRILKINPTVVGRPPLG